MLNFYPEEVAEALHQAAELAGRKQSIPMTPKYLHELADKLTGGFPRPGPTDRTYEDWVYRYPRLEAISIERTNGTRVIVWLKPKAIDSAVWAHLYIMGWRPARFPCPALLGAT